MLPRSVAWSVALAATLTMTVSYIDRNALAVLAPAVTKELDIDEQMYGWLASAFSIAYLVATPLAGRWIDRIGARRGLVWSVLVWSMVAAGHSVVPGFGVLFALRIALGFAEGPSFPGAAQTVQRVLPPAERARGFGVLFTGSSIGGMLVPPLASYLYRESGDWRVAFVGTAAIGLLWVPIWIALTRRPEVRAQMDTVPTSDLPARPSFGALVRHPIIARALCAIFAVAPAVGFAQAWGAKYLDRAFGVPQGDVGSYLWLPPLMLDAGAILFGDLAARRRRGTGAPPRGLLAIAMTLTAAMALLPIASTEWEAMALVGISMAGGGAVYTLVTADLLARIPPACVSTASGILAGAQSLALIVVNPLVGFAVDAQQSYDASAIALGVWAVPGCVVWLVWRPAAFSTSRR